MLKRRELILRPRNNPALPIIFGRDGGAPIIHIYNLYLYIIHADSPSPEQTCNYLTPSVSRRSFASVVLDDAFEYKSVSLHGDDEAVVDNYFLNLSCCFTLTSEVLRSTGTGPLTSGYSWSRPRTSYMYVWCLIATRDRRYLVRDYHICERRQGVMERFDAFAADLQQIGLIRKWDEKPIADGDTLPNEAHSTRITEGTKITFLAFACVLIRIDACTKVDVDVFFFLWWLPSLRSSNI